MGDIGDAACHFILDLILIDFENVCAIAYQVLIIASMANDFRSNHMKPLSSWLYWHTSSKASLLLL